MKRYFQSKTKKKKEAKNKKQQKNEYTTLKLCIFELFYVPNFSLNWQFWLFGLDLPTKTYFRSKTSNSKFLDKFTQKRVFAVENRKITLLRASMVVTYYIKLFRTGADRHNDMLMSLPLLDAGTINNNFTTCNAKILLIILI